MDARVNLIDNPAISTGLKHLASAGKIPVSMIPAATQELCRLRASQINGCGFCTDMHNKEALHAGETRCASTWSRPGARRRCSPTPSVLRWR